jgi:hypothetical protein
MMRRKIHGLLGLRDRPPTTCASFGCRFGRYELGQNPNRASLFVRVKYWETIADNLSKAGWSWGYVSAVDIKF